MNKRIVIAGPESTGKSVITAHLADRLHLPSAQEYARMYMEAKGPEYDYELLLTMSRKHKTYQQEQVPENAAIGIFDTDLINYKIWCEEVFGKCHQEILDGVESESSHVYLLCYPDLPWEPDPLRENKDDRLRLFDLHKQELDRLNRPYIVIKGTGADRFAAAEQAALKLIE